MGAPWVLFVVAVVAAGGAAARYGRGHLARRRRWEAAAAEVPPGDAGDPGADHVQRTCRPVPGSRRLHTLAIRAADEASRLPDIEAAFGVRSRAQRAVASAIAAQRAGDERWRNEKLDESAARLVGAIDGTLPHDGTTWTVAITGTWEGDRMRCTYRRWVCGRDGHWPGEPARSWTRTKPDAGSTDIGTLDGCGRRHASLLVAELRVMLTRFVAEIGEE